MDPATAAGLALGSASLALDLFSGVVKGYKYFQKASSMSKEFEIYRLNLTFEYTRILDWADVAGVTRENYRPEHFDESFKANKILVVATLTEIKALLKSMKGLFQRCEMDASRMLVVPEENLSRKEELAKSKDTNINDWLNLNHLNTDPRKYPPGLNHLIAFWKSLKGVATNPKSAIWAVKHDEEFQQSLRRLHNLTSFLQSTAGEHNTNVLLKRTHEIKLGMLQMSASVEEMKNLLVFANGQGCSDSVQKHEQVFSNLVSLGLRYAEINGPGKPRAPTGLQLAMTNISIFEDHQNVRSSANFGSRDVWIEWKTHKPDIRYEKTKRTVTAPNYAAENVERLASLLASEERPEELRVPKCHGFFEDPAKNRFGLVLEGPTDDGFMPTPVTLHDRLQDNLLPLAERVELAKELTTTLLYLHAVHWLHKGLRSDNVLFFPNKETQEWSLPFLSGFEYSRQDGDSNVTTGPPENHAVRVYCHPDYLENRRKGLRFRDTFDIYSLGIVLIEIALWQPIGKVMNSTIPDDVPLEEIRGLPKEILCSQDREGGILNRTRVAMGDRYCNAVKACINRLSGTGVASQEEQDSHANILNTQQAYMRQVVDPLMGIVL